MGALSEAAIAYVARGCPVFPVEPGGKRPVGSLAPAGVKNATTDPDMVARWWRACPEANIGLACGVAFWVLDVDGEAGAASLAETVARHGALPATVTSCTGSGGRHYLFAPDDRARNSVKKVGVGLDTRSTGGYIVAPPSIHPNGHAYRWLDGQPPGEAPIAVAPGWLLELLDPAPLAFALAPFAPRPVKTQNRYAEAALAGELERVALAANGERNDALNRAAYALGQLAGAGFLDPGEVAAALGGAALATGLDRREIEKTLSSALRAGMATPRDVQP
jgi:hypothetical protein